MNCDPHSFNLTINIPECCFEEIFHFKFAFARDVRVSFVHYVSHSYPQGPLMTRYSIFTYLFKSLSALVSYRLDRDSASWQLVR